MQERVRKLNQQLNDYIIKNHLEDNIIFQNIGLFYDMACDLYELLKEFSKIANIKDAVKNSKRLSFLEKINIIKSFYEKYHIDIDIDKLIQDGTLNFIESDIDDNPYYYNGSNGYDNGHQTVDICNNGTIADLPIAVHELGHYRNQPADGRNQLSSLFTEALARCDEFLFLNYLTDLGYKEDVRKYKIYLLQCSYKNVFYAKPLLKLFLIFKELGSISEESYKIMFKETSDYIHDIKVLESQINLESFDLKSYVHYLFDTYISSYLFLKYKENSSFINNINQLHNFVNDTSMFECLKLIELNDLDIEDQEILINSVKEMKKSVRKTK